MRSTWMPQPRKSLENCCTRCSLIERCEASASVNVILPKTSLSWVCAVFESADCRSSTSYVAFLMSKMR